MNATKADPRPWLEKAFLITTKGLPGQEPIQPLLLNTPQVKIHEAILKNRREGRPPRIIVLKARQPGVSTYCEGLVTGTAWSSPHTSSMILTHLDESSEKLLGKCTFGLDHLPVDIKPLEKRRRTSMIKLDRIKCSDGSVVLDSEIQVATASGKELWRGMTLRAVHMSEFAQFPYPSKTLGGIMQAVPKSPDSLVVIESTAQGEGDVFHNEWVRAEAGESAFTPVFIAWWELPDATLPIPRGFKPTRDELEVQKKFKLSTEQVVWYRFVLNTECQGDIDMFNQEYPENPEIAFLTTGQPAFPTQPLSEMAQRTRKVVPQRGKLVKTESGYKMSRDRNGDLCIWKSPQEDHEYAIGGDVAAGIPGADYSCASIFDRNTSEIVAVWHGYITPIEFARILMDLGIFYNEAWIGPEVTGGHGLTVIEEMKKNFYKKLYVYTRVDKIRNTMTNFIGWETNMKTRGLMFDTMHWHISNREIMIWCPITIKELRETRYIDPKRAEGMEHDDASMAAMIAVRIHFEMPMGDGSVPRLNLPDDTVKPAIELVPYPEHNLSKEIWIETEEILRGMTSSLKNPAREYGTVPDLAEDLIWNANEKDWMPEIPC